MKTMKKYVMALDQGTTSSRCILFGHSGAVRSVSQREFPQIFPKPGWVEHDPMEIWSSQISVAAEAMSKIGAKPEEIAAIGITNQRETAIVWDKATGKPVYNAIVWQCRRTAEMIDRMPIFQPQSSSGFWIMCPERGSALRPVSFCSARWIPG